MTHFNLGHHHYHKRIHKRNESSSTFKKIIDKCIYLVAIAAILVTIPQIIAIWIGKMPIGIKSRLKIGAYKKTTI